MKNKFHPLFFLAFIFIASCVSEKQREHNRAESDRRIYLDTIKATVDRSFVECLLPIKGLFNSVSTDVVKECEKRACSISNDAVVANPIRCDSPLTETQDGPIKR